MIELLSKSPSSIRCLLPWKHTPHPSACRRLMRPLANGRRRLCVRIGTLASALIRLVIAGGGMVSAANVEVNIAPKMSSHASLGSTPVGGPPRAPGPGASEPTDQHTRSIPRKRKAADIPLAPHFKRGCVWSDATSPTADIPLAPHFKRGCVWSDATSPTSPAALSTESAPPLSRVPSHLLSDSALIAYRDYISVSTPFDIDRFSAMLHSHPNRALVDSVIDGLCHGFWPLAEGDWKLSGDHDEDDIIIYSEPHLPEDMRAIRAFRDREAAAERWSPPIRNEKLLPGACASPVFVNWVQEKPRVIY
jgi:hypothetical protein